MGDFEKTFNSLNPFFYRNLAKPVSTVILIPVRFSFSIKFINNIFDNFNNIYYCFLLSGATLENYPEK